MPNNKTSDRKHLTHDLVNCCPAFTLIELLISVSIMAILAAGVIPSFSDFTKSQNLTQAFKTLKSDLRIAQSRSLSGATSGGDSKAWGIHFVVDENQYKIFICNPVSTPTLYSQYTFAICNSSGTAVVKTVSLGSNVKIQGVSPSASGVLDTVFDSQNGSVVANGAQAGATATVSMSYSDGTGRQTITITQSGGISD